VSIVENSKENLASGVASEALKRSSFFKTEYQPRAKSPTREMAMKLARWGVAPVRCCGIVEHPDGGFECTHDAYARKKAKQYGKADYDKCQSPGKRPYGAKWQKYLTTDLTILHDEWKGWKGESNVGFATGSLSGLVIIDIDGETGFKSLAALQAIYGPLPKTVLSITGSGGHHYIFRIPAGETIHNSASTFGAKALGVDATKIDIRGEGGQAIAPPSRHKSGNHYQFAEGCSIDDIAFEDVPELPAWAVQLCKDAAAGAVKAKSGTKASTKNESGSDAFVAAAGAMPGGGSAPSGEGGVEHFLSLIGDHEGGAGFDAPIRDAANSYFARNGVDAPAEEIYAILKARILAAECKDGRNESRYATDEYLSERIEGARAFIEANPPTHASRDEKRSTTFSDIGEAFGVLNAKTAVVHLGGKTRFLKEGKDGEVDFQAEHDARLTYAPYQFTTKKKKGRGQSAEEIEENIPLLPIWIKSPDRREYASVTFDPSEVTPQDGSSPDHVYNLWKGFAIMPASEDRVSRRLAQRHIFNCLCNGDADQFLWVCAWFADILQRPAHKPGSSIVATGVHGAGKSIVCDYFGRTLGKHFTIVATEKELLGDFNSHFESCLLMQAEEAYFSGNMKIVGKLKHLITGGKIMLERKGIDMIQIPNYTRFYQTANPQKNGGVVYAEATERRYFVTEVGAQHVGDNDYFDPLVSEMQGDGPAAMMRDLLALDISDVALNLPPRTAAFGEQVATSLSDEKKWWMAVLETGSFPQREFENQDQPTFVELQKWETEGLIVEKKVVFASFNSRVRPHGGGETDERSIAKALYAMVPGLSDKRPTRPNGARPWCFSFPPLTKLREEFTRKTEIRLGADLVRDRATKVTADDLRDPFFAGKRTLGAVHSAGLKFQGMSASMSLLGHRSTIRSRVCWAQA
jgi:hypothetical protein